MPILGSSSRLVDIFSDLFTVFVFNIGDGNFCTLFRQDLTSRFTDTVAAASDDRNFSLHSIHIVNPLLQPHKNL
jgi:hypothetical protein